MLVELQTSGFNCHRYTITGSYPETAWLKFWLGD
jgi:hypothetical protein